MDPSHESERATACIRVIDLETAGNGASDVCEIGWQDVVQGKDGRWQVSPERGSRLVNPDRPITADTMAIHHIRDMDVADAPFWKEVAPSILRPSHPIVALAAHRASFEQRYCTPKLSGGAPWICTWKCALRIQMLRYQRRPEGLVHELGLPAHRALPDAYVTAHHLRDALNEASLEELLSWSTEPGLLPRVPAGPERGKSWDRLATETLNGFLSDRDVDIRFSAQTELFRRGEREPPNKALPAQQTLL